MSGRQGGDWLHRRGELAGNENLSVRLTAVAQTGASAPAGSEGKIERTIRVQLAMPFGESIERSKPRVGAWPWSRRSEEYKISAPPLD